MSGVGGGEGSPSRKVKGEKIRKNCGTRQSKDVSQHQRTSALYIGTDVRYGVLSLSPHHFSFSFPFFFCVGYPNLSPLVSFIIVFLFLQFSFSLSCQISLPATRNAQVPSAPIQSLAYTKKKLSVLCTTED